MGPETKGMLKAASAVHPEIQEASKNFYKNLRPLFNPADGAVASFTARFPGLSSLLFEHNEGTRSRKKSLSPNQPDFILVDGAFRSQKILTVLMAEIPQEHEAALCLPETRSLGTCGRDSVGGVGNCGDEPRLFLDFYGDKLRMLVVDLKEAGHDGLRRKML